MSSPLLELREKSKLFSPAEQEIVTHILEDPQMVVNMTIHGYRERTRRVEQKEISHSDSPPGDH